MANIGATTAFYKVETALTRANSEVSKSMERLAQVKRTQTLGIDHPMLPWRIHSDWILWGTKAGIKGASVVMGYLETGMRVLDLPQRFFPDCKSLLFWVRTAPTL